MKRITQKEVMNRVYDFRKKEWLKNNVEEKTLKDRISSDGVREYLTESGIWKPFWMVNKFDANVCMLYVIKLALNNLENLVLFISVLNQDEYFILKKFKIGK